MLIEKLKHNKGEIWVAIDDLEDGDVAIFKSGHRAVIVANGDPALELYIVITNSIIDNLSKEEVINYLEDEEFGFAYYKPFKDLEILY